MADGKVIVDVDVKDKSARQKIKELGATFKDIDPSIRGSEKKVDGFLSSVGKIASGIGITNLVSAGFSAIKGSVGSAVSRVDTLNNSMRSFKNMGFSTEDVNSAMKTLEKSIQGLPTPLDKAVQGVQSFSATIGDVNKASDVFGAVNDAILGFGGSTEQVDNAVMQMGQAFANGKIDGQTWVSMMNSGMGPAINALAKSMGITTGELKSGLSSGKISVGEFQNALVKLDKQGGGGLKSLHKIAKDSTKGISTSIDNAKTAVTRGLANLIKSFDESIKEITGSSIADWIKKLGSSAEKGLQAMSKSVKKLEPVFKAVIGSIKNVIDYVQSNKDWLVPLIVGITAFVGAVKTIAIANKAFGALKRAMDVAKVIKATAGSADLLKFALQNMSKESKIAQGAMKLLNLVANANPWVLLVAAIAAVVAGLVWFFTQTEVGRKAWQGFVDWLSALWQGVVTFAQGIWTTLATFFTNLWNGIVAVASSAWNGLVAFFTGLWNGIVSTATSIWQIFGGSITGIWNGIVEIARGVWELLKNVIMAPILILIDLLTGNWTKLQSDLSAIWQNIVNAGAQIWDGFKTYIKGILDFFATYFSTIWNGISNAVISIINSIVKGAQGIWNGFVSFVKGFLSDLKGFFSSSWNSIKNSVISIANGIVSGAQKAWNNLKKAVSDTISAVKKTFNKLKDVNLFNIGKHIIQGLIDGIKSMISSVGKVIGNIADKVTGGIRKALKIHSPSKVTYALGEYVGEGLRNGIKSMIGSVGNMSVKLANAAATKPAQIPIVPSLLGGFSVEKALRLNGHMSSPQTIINNINNSRQINKMAEAVSGQGMSVYLDSREVGKGVIQPVSKELGNEWKMNNRKLNR